MCCRSSIKIYSQSQFKDQHLESSWNKTERNLFNTVWNRFTRVHRTVFIRLICMILSNFLAVLILFLLFLMFYVFSRLVRLYQISPVQNKHFRCKQFNWHMNRIWIKIEVNLNLILGSNLNKLERKRFGKHWQLSLKLNIPNESLSEKRKRKWLQLLSPM